jgi:hypothetical protein
MSRRLSLTLLTAALVLAIAVPVLAAPGKPDFSPHIYVHGEPWGTKVTTALPAPKGNNAHSFQPLYVFTNGVPEQLLIATAAPGDKEYRGGRWETWTAMWIEDLPHDKVELVSFEERFPDDFYSVEFHYELGHIILEKGSPGPPPPDYFSCPLLPVKE